MIYHFFNTAPFPINIKEDLKVKGYKKKIFNLSSVPD